MDIRILHGMEGAREAAGLTVVIDVFRAMTVEAILLQRGAARLLPVGGLEQAWQLKRQHPDAKFFDPQRQHIFPERDFFLCTQVNTVPFVLRLTKDPETGLNCMERVKLI